MISTKEILLFTEKVPRSIHSFCVNRRIFGLSVETWMFVRMFVHLFVRLFVRLLDGCFGVNWG